MSSPPSSAVAFDRMANCAERLNSPLRTPIPDRSYQGVIIPATGIRHTDCGMVAIVAAPSTAVELNSADPMDAENNSISSWGKYWLRIRCFGSSNNFSC